MRDLLQPACSDSDLTLLVFLHRLPTEAEPATQVTSVVPWGLVLSAAVVLILLFTGWMGWSMVYRHGVGVVAHD